MTRTAMSNADAAWLHMDQPNNHMIITSVMWFEEPVDWDKLRDVLTTRVLERYPRFSQRVEEPRLHVGPIHLGRLHWVDDPDFSLDRHLVHATLPEPGDDAALQDYVSEVMSEPLPMDRPLWRYHLVDGYKGGAAVVNRIHHCIADGISLSRVLLTMTDGLDEKAVNQAVDTEAKGGSSPLDTILDGARHLLHEGLEIAAHPTELFRLAEQGRDSARALAKILYINPDPRTVLKGHLGEHKYARWVQAASVDQIKAVGRRHDATINDVLMSCTAGALHRYLDHRDDHARRLRAIVPFNLRPLDRPVPASLGNEFGLVFAELPVGIADPLERLGATKQSMDSIKNSPEGLLSYGVLSVIGMTPVQIEKILVEAFSLKGSLVLTNVPGPRQPVSLAGTTMAGVMPWVPASGGVALGVSIFSYDGKVTVGVSVDARLVPDPDVLLDGFHEELAALEAH